MIYFLYKQTPNSTSDSGNTATYECDLHNFKQLLYRHDVNFLSRDSFKRHIDVYLFNVIGL